MENIRRPQKPKLEYSRFIDSHGTEVVHLTAESEQAWSRYLTEDRLAKVALWRANNAKEEVSD